jgi:hypothetical protein
VLDGDWWYVLRHDLRSKYLFENNNVTIPSKGDNQGNDNEDIFENDLFGHLYCGCVILLLVSIMENYVLVSSFYNFVGYEKLTTIYNHHIENTLNSTSIICGFDILLLSYLLFFIKNSCCMVSTYIC